MTTRILPISVTSCGLLLALSAAPSMAAGFSYDYLEGGYQAVDLDSPNVDGDGLFAGGSLLVTQSLFLRAEFDYADFESGIDAHGLELGGGVRFAAAPDVDLNLSGGYLHAEVDTRFGDADDDGFFVGGGVRWMVSEQVELNGGLDYVDLDESGDDLVLNVGGLVHLQARLALLADVAIADDANSIKLGVRYHFTR